MLNHVPQAMTRPITVTLSVILSPRLPCTTAPGGETWTFRLPGYTTFFANAASGTQKATIAFCVASIATSTTSSELSPSTT
jgi:hypothetical protein